ncbi:MAG: AsmA family protein [Lentisphaeria bacterium]|nr:AsmA family protein [Lentisphaeria bacterium]
MSENENKVGVDEIKEPVTTEVANEKPAAEESAPVKKSWGKRIAGIALWVLIVLVAVVLLVLWQIDRVAATATRTIGSAITGTPVDVQSISIRPLAGSVKVKGFTVGNTPDFHNPVAIKVGNFHVALNTASVLTEKIIIDHLELTGVAIDLEYSISKGSNLDAILKNVEKNTGADKKQPEKNADKPKEKTPAKQKQVVIRKLILKDSKVTVSSGMLKTTMSIPLVPIEMTNVGESTDLPGAIKEVLVRIISEIGKVVNFDAIGKGLVSGVEGVGNAAGDVLNKSVELIKNLPGLNSKK